jgi:hypothetical protein
MKNNKFDFLFIGGLTVTVIPILVILIFGFKLVNMNFTVKPEDTNADVVDTTKTDLVHISFSNTTKEDKPKITINNEKPVKKINTGHDTGHDTVHDTGHDSVSVKK